MYCPKCGMLWPDNANYCKNDGVKLVAKIEERTKRDEGNKKSTFDLKQGWKRPFLFIGVLFIILIVIYSLTTSNSDLKPDDLKIKGFYIGMSKDKALENAKQSGYQVKLVSTSGFDGSSVRNDYSIEKNPTKSLDGGNEGSLIGFFSIVKESIIYIKFYYAAFNAEGMSIEEFTHKFCNSYAIPKMSPVNSHFPRYRYHSPYGIIVETTDSYVELSKSDQYDSKRSFN